VIHWWQERATDPFWLRKLAINGFGCTLTTAILIALTWEKFFEGGWITIVITGVLIGAAYACKRHYLGVGAHLRRLDAIVEAADFESPGHTPATGTPNPRARTAVILVNGYNGLGLHTLLHVPRMFGDTFRNYAFIQVGAVDAGNFKGAADIESLRTHTADEAGRYVTWAQKRGYGGAGYTAVGHDLIGEVMTLARQAAQNHPNHVFFAGQLLFSRETRLTRWLHNHTVFTLQRRFFLANLPFVILPIRVGDELPLPDPQAAEAPAEPAHAG